MSEASTKDDDFLATVRKKFELAAEREQKNREEAEDDIRFARLGDQWPETIKKLRELDNRPCLTINKLPVFIRQVVNDARQNKPAIEVHPADSKADKETAEILSGLIRNIEVTSDADVAYDTAIESAVSGGFGYLRVNTAYTSDDAFDQDIVIERIANPMSVYGDPYSESVDGSDWDCAFIVTPMKRDDFADKYKNAEEVDWDDLGYNKLQAPWADGDQILVAEYWHRETVDKTIYALSNDTIVAKDEFEAHPENFEGIKVLAERVIQSKKVTQYVMSGAEVLDTVEWAGKYIPIVPVYGDEVNLDGERVFKSLIRDAKDAQREFNYWRTTAAETVALAPKVPYIGEEGAFDADIEKWSTANDQSHAFITYKKGAQMPQRQPYAGPAAAEIQQALSASDDMKAIIGIYDASLGNRSNETSGVAINARQREGDVSTFHFIDNLSRAIRQTGRILIDLIPKVYNTPRVLRILGQDMKPQTVQVAPGAMQPPPPPPGMEPENEGQEIARIYDITAGKYDLTVKTGPSFTTQREQSRAELVEVIRANPAAAPILGPMYLRASDWPGADEAADKLEKAGTPQGLPPQVQQQMGQMQKAIQDLSQKSQQLEQENFQLKNDNQLRNMELQVKQQELGVKSQEAQAKLISANADAMRAQAEVANPYAQQTPSPRAASPMPS